MAVRIGINPITWSNDDMPELGGDTPLETALREGAEIGFAGFELGNKFPSDPQALAAVSDRSLVVVHGPPPRTISRIEVTADNAVDPQKDLREEREQ